MRNGSARCEKALNEKLMELSASTGQFYKGNLRNGDVLESEASIVVIGDVDCGARVSAKGNIIILGTLKGTAQAGLSGNRNAVVVAMEMAPSQVRISDLAFQKAEKGRLLAGAHDDSCQKWADLFGTHKKELFKCTKFHLGLENFLFIM